MRPTELVLGCSLLFIVKLITAQTRSSEESRSVADKENNFFDKIFNPINELSQVFQTNDLFKYQPDRDVRFNLVIKVFNSTKYLTQRLQMGNVSTLGEFDGKLPTRFIIHGWNAFKNDGSIVNPVRGFLQHDQDYNIITVDWRKGSTEYNYFASKERVQVTGKTVAKFIEFLVEETGLQLDNIHLIGFSLGAQVAGFCGKALNGKIGAIFGLEPALPGFPIRDTNGRLAATDAKYVEVLHTSGGKLGFREPLGHVDFYANGGTNQPGCGIDIWGDCAHPRAIHYFTEALNSKIGFQGRRCKELKGMTTKKCRFMEGTRYLAKPNDTLTSENESAIYWFTTASQPPFAIES